MIMNATTPIGGTTGLDHEDSEAIAEAARWLATTPREQRARKTVPDLRARFGLSAGQAIEAIRESNLILARAM